VRCSDCCQANYFEFRWFQFGDQIAAVKSTLQIVSSINIPVQGQISISGNTYHTMRNQIDFSTWELFFDGCHEDLRSLRRRRCCWNFRYHQFRTVFLQNFTDPSPMVDLEPDRHRMLSRQSCCRHNANLWRRHLRR
jgi:hypothetical protein